MSGRDARGPEDHDAPSDRRSGRAPSSKVGARKVIALVDQRYLEGLRTGIGEAIAEIEIGDMADGLSVSGTRTQCQAPDLRRDGHLFRANVLDKSVDRSLGLSDQLG